MSGNLTLALVIGALYTMGTYLLLQRTLTHIVIGLALLGHGANLLLLQQQVGAHRVQRPDDQGEGQVAAHLRTDS
ncbi:MAG TPA: NADH-quinone oxidoreductase subunit K, partial [Mycobacteriales bacterium]|nr:NADH-quinone oxidoreductase subunit K [Mycobacteriales bacterium]